MLSPLDELRALGLTIAIDDVTATRVWVDLSRINARVQREREYWEYPARPVSDAYDAIARQVVNPDTPDIVLEQIIPEVILAFHATRPWVRYRSLEQLMFHLKSCVEEWKANRLEMTLSAAPSQPISRASDQAKGSIAPRNSDQAELIPPDHQAIVDALRLGERKRASTLWVAAQERLNPLKASKTALYNDAGQDKSEYYKWERGKLPDGSQADRDIRAVLLKSLS